MLIVHHLSSSRSQRILWALEELEVEYEVKRYERNSVGLAPKELLEIHPLGKSPVITDGDVTLAESGAIIEYLVHKYGNGKWKTATDSGFTNDLYYGHYSEGTVMPMLVLGLIFRLVPQRSPWFLRPIMKFLFGSVSKKLVQPQLQTHVKLIEARLEKADWFAGESEPTTADLLMIFPCEAFVSEKIAGPKIMEYVKKVQARPAYKRALEKGGEYKYTV